MKKPKLTTAKAFSKFKQLAADHLIGNNLLIKHGNAIKAFKIYTISKDNDRVKVRKYETDMFETSAERYALAWCIANKYNINSLKEDIVYYSKQVDKLSVDIDIFVRRIQLNTDNNTIVYDRLEEASARYSFAKKQLSKCVRIAKYKQQEGFDNETARIKL